MSLHFSNYQPPGMHASGLRLQS